MKRRTIRSFVILLFTVLFLVQYEIVFSQTKKELEGLNYEAVFDAFYYAEKYSDLKAAFGTNEELLWKHFVTYGMTEGRQGRETFDVHAYKSRYEDLRMAYGEELSAYYLHYIKWGKSEGRIAAWEEDTTNNGNFSHEGLSYEAVFDASYYAEKYSDLKTAFGTNEELLWKHFITYGMTEGRQGRETFDVHAYKNRYEDLRTAYGEELSAYYLHYIKWGKSEGRIAAKEGNTNNTHGNNQIVRPSEDENNKSDLRTGSISNVTSRVNVRSGAGTEHSIVTKVSRGQIVSVLGETLLENQKIWYQVKFTKEGVSYQGWVIGDYLTIFDTNIPDEPKQEPQETDDEKFVKSLLAAGFPESYCDGLLKLHQKYPIWQFVPVLTGLDWNEVIAKESVVGRNLVQNSVNDARKSTENQAYDWKTDTWYGFDGANWVCASPSYIAYCMDPRNFFTENYIFQFETLEFESYQTVEGVSNLLNDTFMKKDYIDTDNQKKNYAESFYTIGKSLGISPYHLASRCLQEQGVRGSNPLISGTYQGYEGYYNYFNVGAYATSTASVIENGLAYAKRVGWNGIYQSLQGGSSIIADSYIRKGQNTIYFEKFNVVNRENLFSHQYMTNVIAAFSEGSKVSEAYEDKNTAFVFRIPVYENMPERPVGLADNGNPNNWLSALTVEGYGLTPAFTSELTEYSLIVPSNVKEVCVYANMVSSKASYTGAGFYTLKRGNNTIQITVTAQNGNTRTYTIDIVRE